MIIFKSYILLTLFVLINSINFFEKNKTVKKKIEFQKKTVSKLLGFLTFDFFLDFY